MSTFKINFITFTLCNLLAVIFQPIALASDCSLADNEAHIHVAKLIRNLKIYKAGGDLAGMNDSYNDLYTLLYQCNGQNDKLGEKFRKFCGYDCHIQLAEYQYFMASDVQYYFNTDNRNVKNDILEPKNLLKHANKGIIFIESGKKLIASTKENSNKGSFRQFVSKAANFNILGAKLYMAQGDSWYKSLSEARIHRLYNIVETTLNEQNTSTTSSTTSQAEVSYKEALWAINEAMLEIPEESYFDSLRLEFDHLTKDLQRRRKSIREGLLFIGIDPEEYKLVRIPQIKNKLSQLTTRISNLEEKISTSIKTFANANERGDLLDVAQNKELRQQSLSLGAYKIAKIEVMAQAHETALKDEIEAVRSQQKGFSRERSKIELQFSLTLKLKELQQRLEKLNNQKEIHILSFEKDNVVQKINDLKWVMNWEIAKSNLDMQIFSMDNQVIQLERDISRNQNELQKITERLKSVELKKDISIASIEKAKLNIESFEEERTNIYDSNKRSMAASICEIETRIAHLRKDAIQEKFSWKDKDGYIRFCKEVASDLDREKFQKERCELRTDSTLSSINNTADLLICVIGIDNLSNSIKNNMTKNGIDINNRNCNSINPDNNLKKLAQDIYKQQEVIAKEKVENLKDQIDNLKEEIKVFKQEFQNLTFEKKLLDRTARNARAIFIAAASIPEDGVSLGALAGPMGGAIQITTKKTGGAAVASGILSEALAKWQTDLAFGQTRFEFNQTKNQMLRIVTQLEDSLDQTTIENNIQALHASQAIVEITGRSLDLSGRLQSALAEHSLNKLECDQLPDELEVEISQLNFKRQSLIAQIEVGNLKNQLIQNQIDSQNAAITQEEANIKILESDATQLKMEQEQINRDTKALEKLITRNQIQKGNIQSLQAGLSNDESDLDRKIRLKKTLESDIFKNTIIDLDGEINYVTAAMDDNTNNTKKLLTLISKQENADVIESGFQRQILGKYQDIYADISNEREKMIATAEKSIEITTQGEEKELFISTQDMIASLTKGIPGFVETKRRLIEQANYLMILLNNRIKSVNVLVNAEASLGLAGQGEGFTYLRTADSLQSSLDEDSWDSFTNQAQIPTKVAEIIIPSSSGLGRALQSNQRAKFEISPMADGLMEELGHFVLWNKVFSAPKAMTIIDMVLKVEFDNNQCRRSGYTLEHKGWGYKFTPGVNNTTSNATLVTGSERYQIGNYFLSSDTEQISTWTDFWDLQRLSLMGFQEEGELGHHLTQRDYYQ